MKVYIVTKSSCAMVGCEALEIIKVPAEMEAAFLKEYEGRILVAGSSVQDVVTKFGMHANDQHQ